MKNRNKWTALLLTAGLCLSLAACGGNKTQDQEGRSFTTHDAEVYIDGLLRENFLGEADQEYLELVGIHEDDVEKVYESALEMDVDYFFSLYDIDHPTDELREEVQELYKEIYTHIKYEIVSAAQQEDGSFSVKVDMYPIDIVQTVSEASDTALADFYEEYPVDKINAMNDREFEAMDREWSRLIVDLYQDTLKEIGNMTVRSLSVLIEENDEGRYVLKTEDFDRLSELVIDYSNAGASATEE
ncbi:MAG: hypothetical protein HFF06_08860 [Oscillospiraceae bacterium]|jgi:hypothetical protein|nr:hypothetical protein [Oscillospiraceae bacterium]